MDTQEFSDFKHKAVHELMALNEKSGDLYQISKWPKWNYDLDEATLTFSREGIPQVIASVQVVGTTSKRGKTWLWGWANSHLPAAAVKQIQKVGEFGETEGIADLTDPSAEDSEYLGWEMTAVAAKVLGSIGAYRCPGNDGFVYLVYSDIQFVAGGDNGTSGNKRIQCGEHGSGFATYVCEHLLANPSQKWFSSGPDEQNKWPDAWCGVCNTFFEEEGEWNGKNESKLKIKLLCHRCYEKLRPAQIE